MTNLLLRFALLAAALSGAAGCRCGAPGPEERTVLPPGVVALVGTEAVDVDTVLGIARAQGVGPDEAKRRAVQDALFALVVMDTRARPFVVGARRTALARALLDALTHAARTVGPPTDEELDRATRRRWWELDRPPLTRTTHAVVVVSGAEKDGEARALAEKVWAAANGTTEPGAFRQAALAVPHAGFNLRVENLTPVAADGRAVDPANPPSPGSETARYSAAVAAATAAIPASGRVSPVVRSEFGYHVILAVEMLPEKRLSLEERRVLLAEEIVAERAGALRDEAVRAARTRHPVQIERAALELTEKVRAPL